MKIYDADIKTHAKIVAVALITATTLIVVMGIVGA